LAGNVVNAVAIDNQGNKWFGTDQGVSKLDGTNWITYNTFNSGLTGNYIFDIAVDALGNKWFATGEVVELKD
jgi:ligand-binding sensor domain-containing protein